MSSSGASSRREWARYGEVPMTRCPDCPRTAPLKRKVTSTDRNGNLGREYVKCESKPEPGKVRSKCFQRQFVVFVSKLHVFHRISYLGSSSPFQILGKCEHFEWLDQYIERIQGEVASSARMAPVKEQFGSGDRKSVV